MSESAGSLDRKAILDSGLMLMLSSEPAVVADHAFTGRIGQVSFETPLRPTTEIIGIFDGFGCFPEKMPPKKTQVVTFRTTLITRSPPSGPSVGIFRPSRFPAEQRLIDSVELARPLFWIGAMDFYIWVFLVAVAMVSGGFENRQPVHSQIQPPGDAGLSHWLSTIDQIPTLAQFWRHSVMPKDSDCMSFGRPKLQGLILTKLRKEVPQRCEP